MTLRHRMLVGSRFPVVTVVLIGGCLAGFFVELVLGRRLSDLLVHSGIPPDGLRAYFSGAGTFVNNALPFFSSLFLHGGFIHLLINISFLWVVGDVVEDVLGRARFVVLFLFGAAAELILRVGVSSQEAAQVPSVGISGSVAALIGGYVVVLNWLGRSSGDAAITRATRLWLLLGVLAWFPLQYLNTVLSFRSNKGEPLTSQTVEPVCWLGLLAAFALGVFLVSVSGPRRARTPSEAVAFPNEETAPLEA